MDVHAGPPVPAAQTNGRAIASFILGILSLVLCCLPAVNLILGIIALVLGILELKSTTPADGRESKRHLALAGAIMGGLGIAFSLVAMSVWIAVWSMSRGRFMEEFLRQLNGTHTL
jgi:uncharacterized membrane protein HdeD (DUF308 family)